MSAAAPSLHVSCYFPARVSDIATWGGHVCRRGSNVVLGPERRARAAPLADVALVRIAAFTVSRLEQFGSRRGHLLTRKYLYLNILERRT